MGTSINGRYDELVVELSGWSRLRAGRDEIAMRVDDVWRVRAAEPRDLVSWPGERVFRAGGRGRRRVVVLDLRDAEFDRIVLGAADADAVVADLLRRGVAREADGFRPVLRPAPAG